MSKNIRFHIIMINLTVKTEQEKDSKSSFEWTQRQFKISLNMMEEELQIIVQNFQTCERYSKIINFQYVCQQRDFLNIFDQPQDLFDYLINNNDVTIENQNFFFHYRYGNLKKQPKDINIKLQKDETKQVNNCEYRLNQIKGILMKELNQRDQRIKVLEENLAIQSNQIKQLQNSLKRQEESKLKHHQQVNKQIYCPKGHKTLFKTVAESYLKTGIHRSGIICDICKRTYLKKNLDHYHCSQCSWDMCCKCKN